MQMQAKTKGFIYFINSIILLVLMIGIGFMEPVGVITPLGMKIIGVFVGMLYGWLFVDLIWPSLLGLVVLGTTGYGAMNQVFMQGFGNNVVLTIILFFIFGAYLESTGLSNTIASWLLKRKFIAGKPWIFILMVFFTAYALAVLINMYAAIIILWGILYPIFEKLGYEKGSNFVAFMLSGVANIVVLGFLTTPWSPAAIQGFGGLQIGAGIEMNVFKYVVFSIILSLVTLVLYVAAARFVFKLDLEPLKNGDFMEVLEDIVVTKKQVIAIIVLIMLLLFLFLPSFLPNPFIKQFGVVGSIALMLAILCAVKIDGAPLLDLPKLARKGVSWDIVCLMAATIPICSALSADQAGVVQQLEITLVPILNKLPEAQFYIICFAAAGILTQFMHNSVLMGALIPVACKIAVLIGANPTLIAIGLLFALSTAMSTPGASSRSGIVFGNTGWISRAEAFKSGLYVLIVTLIALIIVGIPLGMVML